MSNPEIYDVFAIRYGTYAARKRAENFIMTDLHESSMPLD